MTTATLTKCACPSCLCQVSSNAIEKDGKSYCSQACANGHPGGQTCGNPGCTCSTQK